MRLWGVDFFKFLAKFARICHSEPAKAGEESTIKNQALNLKMDSSRRATHCAQNDKFITHYKFFHKKFAPLLSILALFIAACGYLPTSKLASSVFNDKIYVYVAISQQDARNSIYIVDTVRELVINKLGKSPADKDEADDSLYVSMESLSFIPIIYDEYGYVIAYKTRIVLAFEARFKDGRREKVRTSGDYDFAISPNSVISDTARFEAIKGASEKAFDEFVSVIAIRGQQNGKH